MSGMDAFFPAMHSLSASSTEATSGGDSWVRKVSFRFALARIMESRLPVSHQFS